MLHLKEYVKMCFSLKKKKKKVIAADAQSRDFHGFRDYKARIVLHKHW